jgi:CHAT domain-containing protein/Tfp pilus assembly protein PilF
VLSVVAFVHAQATHVDAPAPLVSAAVRPLIEEAVTAAAGGNAAGALAAADRALAAARQGADSAGEAQAHRMRALQLVKIERASDALAAWREAETAWKQAGDGPGQVEALGLQVALVTRSNGEQGGGLLRRTIVLAEAESRRPLATVRALIDVARALNDRSLYGEMQQVCESALQIARRVAPGSLEEASALNGVGTVAYNRDQLDVAREYLQRALTIRAKLAPDSLLVAEVLSNLGAVMWVGDDLKSAQGYFERALAIRERLVPGALEVATSLHNLGLLASRLGDLATARSRFLQALAINEKLAPGSLNVALNLNSLGLTALDQGDPTAARDYHARALAIREKLAPGSRDVAGSLNNLGMVAFDEGDLAGAREYYQRALDIKETLVPDSLDVANSLNNLGDVLFHLGELGSARACHERALAIRQARAPDSLNTASSLNNLGVLSSQLGDVSAAHDYFQRALAIRERLAPDSLAMSSSLNNVGSFALQMGELPKALEYLQRALAIREKLAPHSLDMAESLGNIGEIFRRQGDLARARTHYERALSIRQSVAPDSLVVADSFESLGALAQDEGSTSAARDYYHRSVDIRERLAPGSLALAGSLRDLGRLALAAGDVAAALGPATRAWSLVRSQSVLVVGDEAQQGFGSHYQSVSGLLVRLQVALEHSDEAFVTLEEGRAQALLRAVSERGIARRLAPPEAWQRYAMAQAVSNRAGSALEEAGRVEARAIQALDAETAQQSAAPVIEQKRLDVAVHAQATERARQDYARARVETDRRWADVRQTIRSAVPTPADAAAARASLPAGAVLAAFAVGDEGSTLFLVRHEGPVRAFPLTLSLQELTARVDFVRRAVARAAGTRGLATPTPDQVRIDAARTLYQKLFPSSARDAIAGATRVLLSPDGALWDLPFAALVINESGEPRYLGLEKPLVYTQSLATIAQTLKAPRPTGRGSVLVIGNPLFDNSRRSSAVTTSAPPPASGASLPAKTRATGELALLGEDGEIPEPLPHAEVEATRVAAVYGARAATGAGPTEAWFRQRAGAADVIHLATHGYFNPFRAASSGIRLAVPERPATDGSTDNDGALQAWEVFTQLQLRADLVVLSACETGVGAKVPGEGLVGLTRAFQVAGAASVVATVWRIADRSTSTAMVAFHRELRKGVPRDEALRAAARILAADKATSHPYYWAAFVLIGDFRPLHLTPAR